MAGYRPPRLQQIQGYKDPFAALIRANEQMQGRWQEDAKLEQAQAQYEGRMGLQREQMANTQAHRASTLAQAAKGMTGYEKSLLKHSQAMELQGLKNKGSRTGLKGSGGALTKEQMTSMSAEEITAAQRNYYLAVPTMGHNAAKAEIQRDINPDLYPWEIHRGDIGYNDPSK